MVWTCQFEIFFYLNLGSENVKSDLPLLSLSDNGSVWYILAMIISQFETFWENVSFWDILSMIISQCETLQENGSIWDILAMIISQC